MKTAKPGVLAIALPKGAPADPGQQDTEGLGESDMGENEDCLPLKTLAMPDSENGDQMANPAVGDRVSYQVEGTVTRIEGDNAYVKRETVNGEPVGDEDDESDDEPANNANAEDQQERQGLGDMAGQMGGMS